MPKTKAELENELRILRANQSSAVDTDAFGARRISQRHMQFSSTFSGDRQPRLWSESLTGAATADLSSNRASVLLGVSADGDVAVRQTFERFLYRAAFGVFGFATFVMDDADDIAFVLRSNVTGSPVDTRYIQADWSRDTLLGDPTLRNPSQIGLDTTAAQIVWFDYQWLGVGTAQVGFDVDRNVLLAHQIHHANTIQSVYMSTGTLPVRYEIRREGTTIIRRIGLFDEENGIFFEGVSTDATSGTLEQICSSVSREGGDEDPGFEAGVRNSDLSNPPTATTTKRSVLFVRPRYKTVTLRAHGAKLTKFGTNEVEARLLLGGTFSGTPSFAAPFPNAAYEVAEDQLTFTEGTQLHEYPGLSLPSGGSSAVSSSVSIDALPHVGWNVDGTPQFLALIAQAGSGAAQNVFGHIYVKELY